MAESNEHWLDKSDDGEVPPEIAAQIAKADRALTLAEHFIAAVIEAEGDAWYGESDEGSLLLCYEGEDGDANFDVYAAMLSALAKAEA